MLEFLTVVGLVVLLVVGVLVTTACLVLRRLRRSRLVAAGTQVVADGPLAVTALRPRPTRHRGAALRATAAPGVDDGLAREAEEAALGLRLPTAAHTELMAAGEPRRSTSHPLADAS